MLKNYEENKMSFHCRYNNNYKMILFKMHCSRATLYSRGK